MRFGQLLAYRWTFEEFCNIENKHKNIGTDNALAIIVIGKFLEGSNSFLFVLSK